MKRIPTILFCLLTAAAIAHAQSQEPQAMPPGDEASSTTFTFAPVAGQPFRIESELDSKLHTGGSTLMNTNITTVREGVWHEREDGGWRLVYKPVEHHIEGQMDPVAKAVVQTLLDQTIQYLVAPDGSLQEVIGFKNMEEDFAKHAPEGVSFEPLAGILSPKAQKWEAEREYNERLGRFAGMSVATGETWSTEKETTLPTGTPATLFRRNVVSSIQPLGGATLVTIDYAGATNLDNLVPLLNRAIDQVADKGEGKEEGSSKLGGLSVSERGRLQLDAATLRVLSQETVKAFTFPVDRPTGETVQYRRVDQRRIKFTYPD